MTEFKVFDTPLLAAGQFMDTEILEVQLELFFNGQ